MFKFIFDTGDYIFYDNQNIEFYDLKNNPIKINYSSDINLNIINIRLILGLQCNFNCIYCEQNEIKSNLSYSIITESYIKNYVEHIYNYISSILKTDLNNYIINISFWGGEPLLYIDMINLLLPYLNKIFNNPNYGTCTNGFLLNDNIYKFLKTNNISFSISHDGPGQLKTRKIEILNDDKILNIINDGFNSSFIGLSPVFSKYNSSYINYIKYYNKYFNSIKLNSFTYIKMLSSNNNNILCNSYNFHKNNKDLINAINNQYSILNPFKDVLDSSIYYYLKVLKNKSFIRCFYNNQNSFVVDLNGNIQVCHNSTNIIDNIFNNKLITKYNKKIEFNWCKDCLLNNFCFTCPNEITNNRYKCYKAFYSTYPKFYNFIQKIFNKKLVSIVRL